MEYCSVNRCDLTATKYVLQKYNKGVHIQNQLLTSIIAKSCSTNVALKYSILHVQEWFRQISVTIYIEAFCELSSSTDF